MTLWKLSCLGLNPSLSYPVFLRALKKHFSPWVTGTPAFTLSTVLSTIPLLSAGSKEGILSVRPSEGLCTALFSACCGKEISFILYMFPHHLPVIVCYGFFLVHFRHNKWLDALVYIGTCYPWSPFSAQCFSKVFIFKSIQTLPVMSLIDFRLSHPHMMTKVISELEICTLVF